MDNPLTSIVIGKPPHSFKLFNVSLDWPLSTNFPFLRCHSFYFYGRIAIPGNRPLAAASTAAATSPSSSTLNRRAVAIVDVKRTSSQRLPNTTKPPLWLEFFLSFALRMPVLFCTPFSCVLFSFLKHYFLRFALFYFNTFHKTVHSSITLHSLNPKPATHTH